MTKHGSFIPEFNFFALSKRLHTLNSDYLLNMFISRTLRSNIIFPLLLWRRNIYS